MEYRNINEMLLPDHVVGPMPRNLNRAVILDDPDQQWIFKPTLDLYPVDEDIIVVCGLAAYRNNPVMPMIVAHNRRNTHGSGIFASGNRKELQNVRARDLVRSANITTGLEARNTDLNRSILG